MKKLIIAITLLAFAGCTQQVITEQNDDASRFVLVERTNIKSSHAEMAVLNTFLRRCWQMGWLSQYDPIFKVPKDDNEPLYHY